jgi:tetratricopeptide (TPR) repeat protein/DNA-binding NarL/FixJ family response regulator
MTHLHALRKFITLFFIFWLGCNVVFSQSIFSQYKNHISHRRDSFLVYSAKIMALGFNSDTIRGLELIDSTIAFAKNKNVDEFYYNSQLLKANFLGWCTHRKQEALQLLLEVKTKAKAINNNYLLLRAYNFIGRFYFINEAYDLSFEQYLESWPLLNSISPDEFVEKKRNIQSIGKSYYFFNDYKQSIHYLRKSLEVPDSYLSKEDDPSIYNTLGMSYRQLRNFDSSNYYFQNVISLPNVPEIWRIIAAGNLGENYVLQQKFDDALPFLNSELEYAHDNNDRGLESHAAMFLAEVAIRTGNLPEAARKTRYAQMVLEQTKNAEGKSYEPYWRFEHLFSLLSRVWAVEGNTSLASLYSDSVIIAKDSTVRKFNSLNLLRAQQKIDRQKHEKSIEELRHKKLAERNIFIGIAVLLCIAFLFAFIRQRYRLRYQQQLHELALQKAQSERDHAAHQLQEFAKHLSEKNMLIEALEAKMDDSYADAIKLLQSKTALISEDWEKFRLLFEKVHSGYLQNLKSKVAGISPAELRFMALAKLGFSNKEMAAAIGVSAEAMRSVWHRLRKKLELSDDTSVEDFVESI